MRPFDEVVRFPEALCRTERRCKSSLDDHWRKWPLALLNHAIEDLIGTLPRGKVRVELVKPEINVFVVVVTDVVVHPSSGLLSPSRHMTPGIKFGKQIVESPRVLKADLKNEVRIEIRVSQSILRKEDIRRFERDRLPGSSELGRQHL